MALLLAGAVALQLQRAVYFGIYLVSSLGTAHHVSSTLDRLIVQITPSILVLLVAGLAGSHSGWETRTGGEPASIRSGTVGPR